MKIVLDSNIIVADFWLQSANFRILFDSANKGNLEIFIPEIVLDEVLNKFKQRIIKSKKDIDSELKVFQKLTKEKTTSIISEELLDSSLLKYQKHLMQVVKEKRIKVLPYPEIEHKLLANKAMLKLKPFNENEKGYRDCLIWENIKSLLTEEEIVAVLPELVFVSTNHKDFATPELELHSDLKNELIEEDFNPASVKFYKTLSELNDERVKIFYEQAKTFKDKLIEENIYGFELLSVINDHLYRNFIGTELNDYMSDLEYNSSEPTVQGFDDNYDIEITSVIKFTANEFIVDVKFELDVEIDLFMEKNEYWHIKDANVNHNISVQDSNWNKFMMLVSTFINITMSMTIILNTDFEVVSCQIGKIKYTEIPKT